MPENRRRLDDELASQFVFGEEKNKEQPAGKPMADNLQPGNVLARLQAEQKEPTVRLTIDLAESLHRKLSVLAARTGRKKVEIVRALLSEALRDVGD